jgi:hypothetical protein
LEGTPFSRLRQQMAKYGYNKDVDIVLGTVTSPPPALKVRIDNEPIELEAEDLIVSQHLTDYQIPFTASITKAKYESAPAGTLNDQYVDVSGQYALQKEDYKSLDFTFDEGTITLKNALKNGDRVILAECENGQTYVVLDRAVKYV